MVDYNGRRFRSVSNSDGGDVSSETTFEYWQKGDVVWATYSGGAVRFGTLVARVNAEGDLDMRYHHIATDGTFKAGRCTSTPEVLADGRIRLHESWEWTDGAAGMGTSIVEEIE